MVQFKNIPAMIPAVLLLPAISVAAKLQNLMPHLES